MRTCIAFLAGFVAGMLFLAGVLWKYGSLQPVRAAAPLPAASAPVVPPPAVQTPVVSPPRIPPPPPMAAPEPAMQNEVPDLLIPVQGVSRSSILDTFHEGREGRQHEAVDIMAPRGTPVLAAAGGTIVKLFQSRRGGITIYEFDPTKTWCYYYAHLDRYATGITEDMTVRKGQVIGYVGSTGDASPEAPHLHFAIFRLGPEKKWWQGTAINPYPILMRHAH
jgi:peptidoglycan LD-endopeptidase LytH